MFKKLLLVFVSFLLLMPFSPAKLDAVGQERKAEVLFFGADWCLPCRQMKQTMKDPEIQAELKKIKFNYYDVDIRVKEKKEWQVATIPSLIVINKQGKGKRYVGAMSKSQLLKILKDAQK